MCLEKIENKKESEIPVVQKLIKMLDLEGVTFTLDSLHCQKETVKTIIETGNNYIIQVKKNQPNLYKTLKKNCEPMKLKSKTIEKEKQKGREETREISVYSNIENIDKTWIGIKSIIKIKRKRKSKIKNQEGEYYYISSLNARTKASTFGKIIRGHWGIERYHYLKDVVLREDYSKIRKLNSPSNMSILRNIALNVFHSQKISKITEQMRLLRNNTKKMFDMILA